jgi:hypothetical protein
LLTILGCSAKVSGNQERVVHAGLRALGGVSPGRMPDSRME